MNHRPAEVVADMNERTQMAVELFDGGLYCSQSVLGAFCEKYGMDKDLAFKVSCGLNSGVRCADVCGVVSGAVLVIGLKFGDDKAVCNQKTEEYISAYKEKNRSILCRDLLNCDISTPDGKEQAIAENLFKTRCIDLIESAAQTLIDLGY